MAKPCRHGPRIEKDRLAATGTAFFKTTFSQFISLNSNCQDAKGGV